MDGLVISLIIGQVALFLLAVIFVALYLIQLRRTRKEIQGRAVAESAQFDLQLSLAEQAGRMGVIREFYDVSAHAVTVIGRRAEGAGYAAQNDPEAAVRAVKEIAEAARGALSELRRVSALAARGEEIIEPFGLDEILAIVKRIKESGLPTTFMQEGEAHSIPSGAELAILGILRDGLENSLKHGGEGTTASVTLSWSDDGVQLRIDDSGKATEMSDRLDPTPHGRGMTAMRERAELFDGIFQAAPGSAGFSVRVNFPRLRSY